MKKIISLLLIAMMLLSAFATAVSADEFDLEMPFTDLVDGAWYMEGIEYCYFNGIVSGMSEDTFAPNGTLTRAQFVQILAMYDGADLSVYNGLSCGFDDVKPGHWYNNAVCWAYSQGYVNGMSETRFAPNEPITREQFARILYVYAESWDADVSYRADLSAFEDENKVSSWAYEQVQWAVAIGIISGVSDTALAPRNNATRAQACRMIMTFDGYFSTGYLKNEVFYILVDYIATNGTVSELDPAVIEIVEESEDEKLVMSYDADFDCIFFEYYMGEFEMTDEYGDTYIDYTRMGVAEVSDIQESYGLALYLSDDSEYNYYILYSNVYQNGISPYYEDYSGFEDEYINDNCDAIKTKLNDFITKHITAAGVALEDMFLKFDYNRDGNYSAIADYVMANGTVDKYGKYTVINIADEKELYIKYDSVSGDILFDLYYEQGALWNNSYMWLLENSDEYNYYFDHVNYGNEDQLSSARTMTADGCEVELYNYTIDEEAAYVMEEESYAVFCELMNQFLSGCDLTMADLYVTVE
ncbi:MAG: S-layer homology domain-containing protein [Clostridia bacterium]|nr:S-layer homology domain-containing protein [Clostridia bacterium]